jgi:hypothetical protein
MFGGGERPIDAGDIGVGEGVVIEGRIAVEVVGGREVAGVRVRPLLLQRNTEEGRAADARSHDRQELPGADALLDVVGQVEVRVVELVGRTRTLRVERTDADGE